MKLITKGTWYYEMQILMIVFMWRHSEYKPSKYLKVYNSSGIRFGRVVIWYDTAWTHHGVAGVVRYFLMDLTKNTKQFKRFSAKAHVIWINANHMFDRWITPMPIVKFYRSLRAYLRLYKAGFEIWESDATESFCIYRFGWKGKMINDFSDIDKVYNTYVTVRAGHSEKLS